MGYAWRTIKEQLGEEVENHILRMTFLKGKTVCIQKHGLIVDYVLYFSVAAV